MEYRKLKGEDEPEMSCWPRRWWRKLLWGEKEETNKNPSLLETLEKTKARINDLTKKILYQQNQIKKRDARGKQHADNGEEALMRQEAYLILREKQVMDQYVELQTKLISLRIEIEKQATLQTVSESIQNASINLSSTISAMQTVEAIEDQYDRLQSLIHDSDTTSVFLAKPLTRAPHASLEFKNSDFKDAKFENNIDSFENVDLELPDVPTHPIVGTTAAIKEEPVPL